MDRALSTLMHEARHRLAAQGNEALAEATKAGALQNSRLIIVVAEAAEKIHVEEIIRKLDALVPSAALSYKQAILGNSPRPSSGLPACRA